MSTYDYQSISGTAASAGSVHDENTTGLKLRKFYEEEEGDMIVMEFCQDLITNVMNHIQANLLIDQAHNLVVHCAIEAIKKVVAVNYCHHNASYADMTKESWNPDEPCKPSDADSWAAYRVPVSYDRESDDTVEKEAKPESTEEMHSVKGNFPDVCTTRTFSESPYNSSQDLLSIVDYLEDILSTSSDEEIDESILHMLHLDRLSQHSGKFSARLSAKLSQLTGKNTTSDQNITSPKLSNQDRYMSSTFSKIALGEIERGLCCPHVGNAPVSNVVKDTPEVEQYTLVKEKRTTKVVKKGYDKILPRRRSDTKLKMAAQIEEPSKEKPRERRK